MFGLLVELTNPTLSTPPSNTKRDSEYQMIRYVQAPSLLTPIARALLSALTVREAADPSGWAITHALSLFFAMNSTVDGPSNERWDSECPYHEALKVALLVPLGDTVSAIMVEPPTQSSTDALDAPSNLTPKPSRASVWMSLTFVAPLSSSNRSSCRDSESQFRPGNRASTAHVSNAKPNLSRCVCCQIVLIAIVEVRKISDPSSSLSTVRKIPVE